LSCDYGNLGDYAITKAQVKYLKKIYPKSNIIYVGANIEVAVYRYIRKKLKPEDIITIIGGGNMGDLYPQFEMKRQLICSYFKNNPIIMFPQTIDFSKYSNKCFLFKNAKKVYGAHPKLKIFAREENSFNLMRNIFKSNDVFLVPDIVLSLPKIETEKCIDRNIITTCMRNDKERFMDTDVIALLSSENLKVFETDTHLGEGLYDLDDLEKSFENLIKDFSKSKLIITDRLHGMIFAYLTCTPCLFFDNSNRKVSGVYKWIENCVYIKQTSKENLLDDVNMFLKLNNTNCNSDLDGKFLGLEMSLKGY